MDIWLPPEMNAHVIVEINGYYVVAGCSDTQIGETYQFQTRADSNASWANLGGALAGNGYGISYLSNVLWYQYDDVGDHFRVVKLGKASALVGSPVTADVFGDTGNEVFQEATPEVTATAGATHTIELAHGAQSGLDDVIAVIVPKGSTPTTPGVEIEILGVKIDVTASGKVSFSFPTAIFNSADDWSFFIVYGDANDVLSVELDLMWETANRANQIFNPTRKDDPVNDTQQPDANGDTYGVTRNYLYAVSDPSDNHFKVSLDLDIQPTDLRDRFICAAYAASKITGSDTAVPADPEEAVEMEFYAPSTPLISTIEIKAGYDRNDDGDLDEDEAQSLEVYKDPFDGSLKFAFIRGTSDSGYDNAKEEVDDIIDGDWTSPDWLTNLVLP